MKNFLKKPFIWVATTYFAEGFPYTIIRSISSVFFRDKGASLESIGFTSLYGLPWVLKFLWGPQVDFYSTKKRWFCYLEIILAILFVASAFFSFIPIGVPIIGGLLFLGAFFAATHDIAIDGYYMDALDSKTQEQFVGFRILAYRIGMIAGTGGIITIGALWGWFWGFLSASLIMAILAIFHFTVLDDEKTNSNSLKNIFKSILKKESFLGITILSIPIISLYFLVKADFYKNIPILNKIGFSHWIAILLLLTLVLMIFYRKYITKYIEKKDTPYSKAFFEYINRDKFAFALSFIIFMRAGEFLLHAMVPTFIVDIGAKTHYGWLSGGVGLPASIIGALIGGAIISKWGFKKTAFPLLLIQNGTNLLYMIIAFKFQHYIDSPESLNLIDLVILAIVNGFEQFSAGLGTAVLTVYLLQTCMDSYKTTHFAIGTALMNITGVIAGISGGFLTAFFGYGIFFGASFMLSLPGLFLLFFIPYYKQDKNSKI
ncbi:MFS transporter [bacterium]|nr:MFS transporter [bacterium]